MAAWAAHSSAVQRSDPLLVGCFRGPAGRRVGHDDLEDNGSWPLEWALENVGVAMGRVADLVWLSGPLSLDYRAKVTSQEEPLSDLQGWRHGWENFR